MTSQSTSSGQRTRVASSASTVHTLTLADPLGPIAGEVPSAFAAPAPPRLGAFERRVVRGVPQTRCLRCNAVTLGRVNADGYDALAEFERAHTPHCRPARAQRPDDGPNVVIDRTRRGAP